MSRRPRNWMPGLLSGQVAPELGTATICTLNFGEIYPSGFFAEISVRFRGPLSLEEQRTISSQAEWCLRNFSRSPFPGRSSRLARNSSSRLLKFQRR